MFPCVWQYNFQRKTITQEAPKSSEKYYQGWAHKIFTNTDAKWLRNLNKYELKVKCLDSTNETSSYLLNGSCVTVKYFCHDLLPNFGRNCSIPH